MKQPKFILTFLFQIMVLFAFAQKNAGLKSLLNNNSEFIFPQTPDKISAALGVKTVFYEDANEEPYAKWLTRSGVELYCSLGEHKSINEMFFHISDDKSIVVEGLPFNLALNRTTLQQSTVLFRKYNFKKEKLGEDSLFPSGVKITFKKRAHFINLVFDGKNLLRSLSITTELIDHSVN